MIELVEYEEADSEGEPPKIRQILDRHRGLPPEVEETVRAVLEAVQERGDEALLAFTEEFDGVDLAPGQIRVRPETLARAGRDMAVDLREAIEDAAENIRAFHKRQRVNSWFVEDGDGVILGKKITPIRRVGICVPGGQAPLISSLLMTVIPAQVAGVPEICAVSPPGPNGLPHDDILGAADILGLEEIYAVGGAQAVAALAYGTDSIPAVDKIAGPGGPYTVAAKRLVYGGVGIEMIPGPSEIVILADDSAEPRYIAADLLSQAEHGSGLESAVCVTDSRDLARQVQAEVAEQVRGLPQPEVVQEALERFGAVVLVPDLEVGAQLVNRIAPEHAELMVEDPWTQLGAIDNAGAVFLGPASTEPVGDYFAGTNHVLPTNGAARYASSLGVSDFVKSTSVVRYTPERLARVGDRIVRLAHAESMEAHARAVQIRLEDYGS